MSMGIWREEDGPIDWMGLAEGVDSADPTVMARRFERPEWALVKRDSAAAADPTTVSWGIVPPRPDLEPFRPDGASWFWQAETTCNLEKLKDGYPFTWGKPIQWHEIGPYSILEFREMFNGAERGIEFHIWVDGKTTSQGAKSLDSAIVQAIAYRAEGPNQKASGYFMKMIAVSDE